MAEAENGMRRGDSMRRRRGALPGQRRISPVPPPPVAPCPDWAVLSDQDGPLGFALWRVASDVLLWCWTPLAQAVSLFHSVTSMPEDTLSVALQAAPSISDALASLWKVHLHPADADRAALAEDCGKIAEWAEAAEMKAAAVQFAELAARLEPESSARSYIAGRLCRRSGEHQRAAIWYRRAFRLGRLAGSNIDVANAQLGMGNLESDLGNIAAAEKHFWKAARAALRNGRRSLAAAAFHNLVGVAYDAGRITEATEHLAQAARFYQADHPRFPAFTYDAGYFLMRERYFSSALLVFETAMPWVAGHRVSVLVRSALARSAAAVRDHIRYTRHTAAVLAMVENDDEDSASALYQLAEGARAFQQWEEAQALCTRALALATKRTDARTAQHASALLRAVADRVQTEDLDRVPAEDDPIELITKDLLRKLRKQPVPPAQAPPERYPTE